MIYHIITMNDLKRLNRSGRYHPRSLDEEGFIHCSGAVAELLTVANRFYRGADIAALEIDDSMLGHMVHWEKPTHGGLTGLFPHLYGPIDAVMVASVLAFEKDGNGNCTGLR